MVSDRLTYLQVLQAPHRLRKFMKSTSSLHAELGVTPDEALLILKVADVHKTSGLLGKLSCPLTA